jgi:hypothetical protein
MSRPTPRGQQTSAAELAEVYYERRHEDSDWDCQRRSKIDPLSPVEN